MALQCSLPQRLMQGGIEQAPARTQQLLQPLALEKPLCWSSRAGCGPCQALRFAGHFDGRLREDGQTTAQNRRSASIDEEGRRTVFLPVLCVCLLSVPERGVACARGRPVALHRQQNAGRG